MQKKYRKIIYIIFVTLFLISIPPILLYTAGYKYNFQKNKLEKTGSLFVDLETKDIDMYLNDRYFRIKNELRLPNLLPDEYIITFKKEGYFDWQKKITIESEITTFMDNIRLIKNNLPIEISNKKIKNIYPSINEKYALYESEENLILLNIDSFSETVIQNIKLPVLDVRWSLNNEKFIIETKDNFYIYDIKEGLVNADFININLKQFVWDQKNHLVFYAKNNNSIYKIDLLFKTIQNLYSHKDEFQNFYTWEDYIYLIEDYNLKEININNKEVISIPLERTGYHLKLIAEKRAYLINDNKQKLQIFNLPLNDLSTPTLITNAKDFQLIKNNLLLYNDFELWTYNLDTGTKELITRIGTLIKKAFLLRNTNYIAFVTEKNIKIIELDKRDKRQIFEILKFDKIKDGFENDYTIFFSGSLNNKEALYKLEI